MSSLSFEVHDADLLVAESASIWVLLGLEPHTANEGPVKIQYYCLIQIYLFPEKKLLDLIISKTELLHNLLSPNFHIHLPVSSLYIASFGLPILLQPNQQNGPLNIEIAHRYST
jgi:hypothetical protein